MKKNFLTGLVILLPAALTIAFVVFIFNFLTHPFLGIVKAIFERYHLLEHGFLFFSADQFQTLVAQLMILAFLFLVVLGLGYLASWLFVHTVLKYTDAIVKRIPLVRAIYKGCQDMLKTVFTSNSKSFKQVVLVPFPHPDSLVFGFITQENLRQMGDQLQNELTAVFVPTTPNPTSGLLLLFKSTDIHYLDIKVEEAFRAIISCGVIQTEIRVISKDEAHAKFMDKEGKV